MTRSEQWDSHTTEQGMTYYYNTTTGETTWDCPTGAADPQQSAITAESSEDSAPDGATPAPAPSGQADKETSGGWEAVWAEEHQMYYYCNRATGAAQWEPPVAAQTSPREPPPPYSEAEAFATQHGQGGGDTGIGSVSSGDAGNGPPPYAPHLQPSPLSTAPRPSVAVEPETLDGGYPLASPQRQQRAPQSGTAVAGWQQAEQTPAAPPPVSASIADGGGPEEAAAAVTAGGGAAFDATTRRLPAAGARRAAPARPPMEREDSVLRDALSRRKESLRRLEDVRAGARARLAALKAETDARRAAKQAASSGRGKKGTGAKVPPPPLPPRLTPVGNTGADAIPATASPAAPEPLPSLGDRAAAAAAAATLGPARGGDEPAGGLSMSDDPVVRNAGSTTAAEQDDGLLEAAPEVPALAAGAVGVGHGSRSGSGSLIRVAAGSPDRPTNKRRQVPRRKETAQKADGTEEEEKEKEEGEKGGAVVAEVPGVNKGEEEQPGASIGTAAPTPALPAELKNVEGFKTLWRESVKVRHVKGDSGEVPTGAKGALGEQGARPDVQDDDDGDGGEAEAGWTKIDLLGKEAGDEIAAISALVSDDHPGHVPHGGGGGGGAVSGRGDHSSVSSIEKFSEALRSAIDNREETETDTGTDTDTDIGLERRTYPTGDSGAAGQPLPTSAGAKVGLRGEGSDGGGSAAAAAAAGAVAAAAAGSTRSTEALSPSSAASSSSPPCALFSSLAAVHSSLGRVFRLRELLGSVGEARVWARLLGGDDHMGCRRLADLALSSSEVVLLPRKDVSMAAGSVSRRLTSPCRCLCSAALECLAMCGRISPGVWADLDLSRDDGEASNSQDLVGGDGGGCRGRADGGSSRLTRLLSLGLSLAENNKASAATTGLNEHEYFFGKGTGGAGRRRQGDRDGVGQGQEEEEEEEEREEGEEGEEPGLPAMGLVLIYEILTGSCKGRVEGLRCWGGMGGLVESLMKLLAQDQQEEIYMGATRCLLAANDPFLRPPLPAAEAAAAAKAAAGAAAAAAVAQKALAAADTGRIAAADVNDGGFSYGFASFRSLPAPLLPRSTVVSALLGHPARHEVQGAVLHIFNEEGYPNGDAALAKLCLAFCSDAFEEGRDEDLFYVNDVKVLLDVIIRELANLPADDGLRADYNGLLAMLLDQSEWATRGGRYREEDIKHAMGGQI